MIERPKWKGADAAERMFIIAVAIKGVDGILEVVGAFLLSLVRPSALNSFVAVLTEHELKGAKSDAIFLALRQMFVDVNPSKLHFAAAFLFIHGAIKAFMAVTLLSGKPWSFQVGTGLLALFMIYTGHRLSIGWSWLLFAFLVFDLITLVLVLREWQTHSRNGPVRARPQVSPPHA